MDAYKRANRTYWDLAVPVHLASAFYRADAFRRGGNVLDPIVRERLGDVAGKKILHLQCHFGLDSLCLARMGADVTGIDFSPPAIETARKLAHECGLNAHFIESDVTAPTEPLKNFDIVFASWGAICWIEDIEAWMHVAAGALRPGGRLHLIDGHPVIMMMDEHADPSGPFVMRYPYQSPQPVPDESSSDYAEPSMRIGGTTYLWQHGIGEIVSAAIAAGLEIRRLEELDRVPWVGLPHLIKRDEFYWSLAEGVPFLPLAFALEARRPLQYSEE